MVVRQSGVAEAGRGDDPATFVWSIRARAPARARHGDPGGTSNADEKRRLGKTRLNIIMSFVRPPIQPDVHNARNFAAVNSLRMIYYAVIGRCSTVTRNRIETSTGIEKRKGYRTRQWSRIDIENRTVIAIYIARKICRRSRNAEELKEGSGSGGVHTRSRAGQRPHNRSKKLDRQARKMVFKVYNYFEQEASEGVNNIKQVQQRTADATGVSVRTVRNILLEAKQCDSAPIFRTPGKKRSRNFPVTGINDFEQKAIRRAIQHFHLSNELLTLEKLRLKLKKDINFTGSRESLRRIIKRLGIKWRKPGDIKKEPESNGDDSDINDELSLRSTSGLEPKGVMDGVAPPLK
ncbi:hypothetical protein EVAR_83289_1 [Eumeta japonica]|uniref:Uncharacterized protein n=1 Tax=Eumeta variegata TaxID=151549 RepID=A0A4C1X954_EUMVA|nr:hypothetical protein EVAR_83289_1 [Eumeta japonica]